MYLHSSATAKISLLTALTPSGLLVNDGKFANQISCSEDRQRGFESEGVNRKTRILPVKIMDSVWPKSPCSKTI
jgi:hypothetical protein